MRNNVSMCEFLLVTRRINLVVCYRLFDPKFKKWWEPTTDTLSFYECRLSGGDTQM